MTLFKENNTDSVSLPDSNPVNLLHSCKPKDFHQWQNLRRAMGSQYHSPKVQKQLIRDAQTLGAAFYDTDNSIGSNL